LVLYLYKASNQSINLHDKYILNTSKTTRPTGVESKAKSKKTLGSGIGWAGGTDIGKIPCLGI
jgi:hypothetical protein